LALYRLSRSGRGYEFFFVYKKEPALQLMQSNSGIQRGTHCQACWLEAIRSLIHYVKSGAVALLTNGSGSTSNSHSSPLQPLATAAAQG